MKTAVRKPKSKKNTVAPPPADTAKRGRKKKNPDNLEDIWKIYKKTHDENLRNVLIEKHMPLVKYISERLLLTLPKSIELDDLISAGVFGLMDAIDGFDLERGIKFKTYCTTRIRGSILDELRSQDWVPRLVRLKAHQINKALKTLEMNHGREPTDYEMAK
ncbi:MAG: sigma-70 family RNA polymerase sigma factor, partial [Planctomycetota bacterium]